MRLGGIGESSNVSDRRGMGLGGGAVALSGTGIVVALVVGLITGENPLHLLGIGGAETTERTAAAPDANDPGAVFTRKVLKTTEDAWNEVMPKTMGRAYQEPKLVLFRDHVRTACGTASSAVGPFYCPGDRSAFLDLDFLDSLQRKLGANGDFAAGYVIAHEIGHHVQNLTGVMKGNRDDGAEGGSVRVELQADCYAGVWANHVKSRGVLEPGDVEEALGAASAIGDDNLQKRAKGRVSPETFSHGTSEQRVRWFKRGMETGDPRACDTFGAPVL
jgi:predicted metalloprotease